MKKATKTLLLMLCAVVLVVSSVLGTVAYLTSEAEVKNTFTVGKVQIKLEETNQITRTDGTVGLDLHLLPGIPVDKDPTVTVLQNSEDCYVRMKVAVANVTEMKAAFAGLKYTGVHGSDIDYVQDNMLLLHLIVSDWKAEDWAFASYSEDTTNDIGTYEFRYVGTGTTDGIMAKPGADTKLPALFTEITIPGAMDNTKIANLASVEVNVTAEAIQAAGFVAEGNKTAADVAWESFPNN